MSTATPQNISNVIPILVFASLAVGSVIIPCSIIAQLVCPVELIGTITAITLSIRYIGGAIAFTAYDNSIYRKLNKYILTIVAPTIVENGIAAPTDTETITALAGLAAQAKFSDLQAYIAASPTVGHKAIAYDVVIGATQEAYALAFRYPYWISIAFGVISLVCACFLRDVRTVLKKESGLA